MRPIGIVSMCSWFCTSAARHHVPQVCVNNVSLLSNMFGAPYLQPACAVNKFTRQDACNNVKRVLHNVTPQPVMFPSAMSRHASFSSAGYYDGLRHVWWMCGRGIGTIFFGFHTRTGMLLVCIVSMRFIMHKVQFGVGNMCRPLHKFGAVHYVLTLFNQSMT